MRKLLCVLALLLWPALANAGDIYRPALTYHGTASGAALAQTTAMATGIEAFRLTCVAACYYSVAVTNGVSISSLQDSMKAANATAALLNATMSVTHLVGQGEFVIVIQSTAAGLFSITELTK